MKFPFDDRIILENGRTRLEPLQSDHFEALSIIARENPDLLKYSPSPWGTPKLLKQYIVTAIGQRSESLRYPFVIFDRGSETYAGSTSFLNISDKHSRLEIGSTWIGKSYQRTGLNRNAKFLLMDYVFTTLGCKRLEFKTDARNKQSRMGIEGVGGKYEGLLRSHTLMPDGYRRDTVYYSVLAHEWPSVRNTVFKNIKV